jgi:hypothetical protein
MKKARNILLAALGLTLNACGALPSPGVQIVEVPVPSQAASAPARIIVELTDSLDSGPNPHLKQEYTASRQGSARMPAQLVSYSGPYVQFDTAVLTIGNLTCGYQRQTAGNATLTRGNCWGTGDANSDLVVELGDQVTLHVENSGEGMTVTATIVVD